MSARFSWIISSILDFDSHSCLVHNHALANAQTADAANTTKSMKFAI
jgi:hypothetical protein